MVFNPSSTRLLDSAFDFATFSLIAVLLFLSLLSLLCIFHLQIKSRSSPYLQQFNSLWTVRFILVLFIALWVLNELLRVPFFRHRYLFPLFPPLTLTEQARFCKVHIVLSLGFFEPGFLVTLLFLVDVSIKKKTPRGSYAAFFLLASCLPILLLQIFLLFFLKLEVRVPAILARSSSIFKSESGEESVLCAYPLLSTALFAAFGGIYMMFFLLSFWRVVSLVINKALRKRICALAVTVTSMLPIQVLLMASTVFLRPEKTAFSGIALLVFLTTFTCTAVGQGFLVIRPIADSLAAGGECCAWTPDSSGSRRLLPSSGDLESGNEAQQ